MRSPSPLLLITLVVGLAAGGPTLALAAPPAGGSGAVVDDLQLTVTLDPPPHDPAGPIIAHVTLTNVGTTPRRVWSHVATHETHYDWFEADVSWPVPTRGRCGKDARAARRTVGFSDGRDKSAPVARVLAPGERLTHDLDLARWLTRAHLLGKAWGPGSYQVRFRYVVAPEAGMWSGTLTAPAVGFEVRGRRRAGVCARNPGWARFAP